MKLEFRCPCYGTENITVEDEDPSSPCRRCGRVYRLKNHDTTTTVICSCEERMHICPNCGELNTSEPSYCSSSCCINTICFFCGQGPGDEYCEDCAKEKGREDNEDDARAEAESS